MRPFRLFFYLPIVKHNLVSISYHRRLRRPLLVVHRLGALAVATLISTTTTTMTPRLARRVTVAARRITPDTRQACGVIVRAGDPVVSR
jgi:hypothetical protein